MLHKGSQQHWNPENSQGFLQVCKREVLGLIRNLVQQCFREVNFFVLAQLVLPIHGILSSLITRGIREIAKWSEYVLANNPIHLTTCDQIETVGLTGQGQVSQCGLLFRSDWLVIILSF